MSNQIDYMPGSYASRISCKAIDAEDCVGWAVKRQVIDLGCDVPFEQIPALVEEGFTGLAELFAKGDQRI